MFFFHVTLFPFSCPFMYISWLLFKKNGRSPYQTSQFQVLELGVSGNGFSDFLQIRYVNCLLSSKCIGPFTTTKINKSPATSFCYNLVEKAVLNKITWGRALLPHGQFGQLPKAPRFLGPPNCSLKKTFLSLPIYIYFNL